MKAFRAFRCEKARSIEDMLNVQNVFPASGQADSCCRDERVHVYMSESKKNVNDRLKDLSLLQNTSLSDKSELTSAGVMGKVHDIFRFKPLHNQHLGVSKLLKRFALMFLGSDRK